MAFFAISFFFKAFFTISTKPHYENCGNKHIKYGSIKGQNCVTVKLKTIYFRYIKPFISFISHHIIATEYYRAVSFSLLFVRLNER